MASTKSETFAQWQCTQKGGPFKLVQTPTSEPASENVSIRQRVIAFNPFDVKKRDYGLMVQKWPVVLGSESAGVVEAVGSGVRDLKPGDEVMAWAFPPELGGAFQERVEVPQNVIFKKPKNVSWEEAAALPINYITAICTIMNSLKIPLPFIPGTSTEGKAPASVLVLGGSSGVGAAAIQLLRQAYPSLPILTTSSPKHAAHLKDLGATAVIDYKSPSVINALKEASPNGAGVDVIIDAVSAGASQTDICDVFDAADSKTYAAVITGATVEVPEGVKKVGAGSFSFFQMQGRAQVVSSLTKLVEEGTYKVPVAIRVAGHGFEKLPDVLDQVKTASGEKVVLTLNSAKNATNL